MTASLLTEATAVRVSGGDIGMELLEAARGAAAVPVERVGSTGAAALEPLLMATAEGRTGFYYGATAEQAEIVSRELGDSSGGFAANPDAVVEHEAGAGSLPVPADGPLSVGVRDVLGRVGWVSPASTDDHAATGGFAADDADKEDLLAAASRVHGRGWGDGATDKPAGDLWEQVSDAAGDPAIVVNAHGTAADRLLVEGTPLTVLEGAAAAARAVDASEVVVYLSEADEVASDRVSTAIEAYDAPAEMRVATGEASYKAAEPTMALEAIEGNHRLEARLRPPGPAEIGLHGRPTLIHTPRTLAQVLLALSSEPTRLVTVKGDVEDSATVELPSDWTLEEAVAAVEPTAPVKAACVGGRFGGLTDDLDVPVSAEALAGADLGTEGVVELLAEGRCSVAFAGERARFAEEENCGRCVPCREGSQQLTELLREVYDGSYRPGALEELMGVMESTSICAFGVDAPRPVRTAMAEFEREFEAHADGRCPADACDHMEART